MDDPESQAYLPVVPVPRPPESPLAGQPALSLLG